MRAPRLAASKLYKNINIDELGRLLQIDAAQVTAALLRSPPPPPPSATQNADLRLCVGLAVCALPALSALFAAVGAALPCFGPAHGISPLDFLVVAG